MATETYSCLTQGHNFVPAESDYEVNDAGVSCGNTVKAIFCTKCGTRKEFEVRG